MFDATCSVDGCKNRVRVKARALCSTHYNKWRTRGSVDYVEPRRLATENVDVHGYRRIKVPGHPMARDRGWALEHRVVAWDHFGPFDPSMQVHHKNHDRLDNRPENLELLTAKQHADEHHPRTTDRAEVERLYLTGLSTVEVAALVGTYPGNVYRILVERGVRVLSASERAAAKYAHAKVDAMAALRSGEPLVRVARRLGVPRSRLHQWRQEDHDHASDACGAVLREDQDEMFGPAFPCTRPRGHEGRHAHDGSLSWSDEDCGAA